MRHYQKRKYDKVLVTGGAGFIGSHLCEKLLQKGEEVFALDNLSTGRIENIAHLKKDKKFHFVKDTILNRKIMEGLVKKCGKIYHLAAAVGVKTIMEKPLESFLVNIEGTAIALEMANKYKRRFLFTSSSEVYGKNDVLPFKEEDDRTYGSAYNDRWGYGLSKGADEFLALAYFREKKLPVIIVRLFNVIGPRQSSAYGMVAPRFIKQALSNQNLTIFGDGYQTRCFADIKDVVEGLVKLMDCPKAAGQIFNIGSEEEITIKDLAKKIKTLCQSKSRMVYVPYSKAYREGFEDMRQRKPDISKVRKLIGFEPKISLEESLKKIIDYHKVQP